MATDKNVLRVGMVTIGVAAAFFGTLLYISNSVPNKNRELIGNLQQGEREIFRKYDQNENYVLEPDETLKMLKEYRLTPR